MHCQKSFSFFAQTALKLNLKENLNLKNFMLKKL